MRCFREQALPYRGLEELVGFRQMGSREEHLGGKYEYICSILRTNIAFSHYIHISKLLGI